MTFSSLEKNRLKLRKIMLYFLKNKENEFLA